MWGLPTNTSLVTAGQFAGSALVVDGLQQEKKAIGDRRSFYNNRRRRAWRAKGKNTTMRHIRIAFLAVLVMIGLTTPAAFAGSPHFIKNATFAARSGDNLVVSFKEAGLESGSVETVKASALATAVFECVNGGNNVPSDPKKTTISSDVSASGQFSADKNGNIQGSLTINPPSAA